MQISGQDTKPGWAPGSQTRRAGGSLAAHCPPVPAAGSWLPPVLPRIYWYGKGHWAQRPPGTVEGQRQVRWGQVSRRAGEEHVSDGAWGSPGNKVEGGWDVGQVRGDAGRGYRCPQRGVCVTTGGPWQGWDSGPRRSWAGQRP